MMIESQGKSYDPWARLGNLMWADGVGARLSGTKDKD